MNNNLQLDQPRQQASVQHQHRIPFEQLKRAVSSNLPWFFIQYEQTDNSKNRPSDISAARPSQVNDINITVNKQKFTPNSFALVVGYVPLQYDDELVKEEIKRNLQSVENIRRIQYPFQRSTNDFRFIIKEADEYNSTLKLGRISIGNTFCTITPFLTTVTKYPVLTRDLLIWKLFSDFS
ncbi:unnamed protein product [Rotaria magnacalcarata]|uniref:Uncharacterized protein n=1 Tax=Rotaria magnacalcarata TaxID=392030 RepID=A0A819W4Y7_9BILA|nr:unnamed protein product [Rotaria magnacalcarata]